MTPTSMMCMLQTTCSLDIGVGDVYVVPSTSVRVSIHYFVCTASRSLINLASPISTKKEKVASQRATSPWLGDSRRGGDRG